MTLTLQLPTELERRLQEEAKRQGKAAEQYTLELLDQHLPSSDADRRQKAIALLRSWREEGDEQEQKEVGEFLIRALDEDRPSYRKLFPPELKGISW